MWGIHAKFIGVSLVIGFGLAACRRDSARDDEAGKKGGDRTEHRATKFRSASDDAPSKTRTRGTRNQSDISEVLSLQNDPSARLTSLLNYLAVKRSPAELAELYNHLSSDSEKASITTSALANLDGFDQKWEFYQLLPAGSERQNYCSRLVVQEFNVLKDPDLSLGRLHQLDSHHDIDKSLTNLFTTPEFIAWARSPEGKESVTKLSSSLGDARAKKFAGLIGK